MPLNSNQIKSQQPGTHADGGGLYLVVRDSGERVWALHQYLIGPRRRHPWLHAASTTALRLESRHFVYATRSGDDVLLVALNIDDQPLRLELPELGTVRAQVLAGSSAPPQEVVDEVVVEAHGWRILEPA